MKEALYTALIHDLSVLAAQKEVNMSDLEKYYTHSALPKIIGGYLLENSVKTVAEHIADFTPDTDSPLHQMLCTVCAEVLLPTVDSADTSDLGTGKKFFSGTSHLEQAITQLYQVYTYHAIIRIIKEICTQASQQIAEVQSAVSITADDKSKIRNDLYAKGKIAVFTVEPELIGGIRIFTDNTVIDASWRAQIQDIISLGK